MNNPLNFNVFNQNCPAREFFEKIADKWILLIIYRLHEHSYYFNELKKNLTGISPKVLSQKLKILERDGFISRTIHENNIIRVEYNLTPLGFKFAENTLLFKTWAEDNMQYVILAQKEFDKNLTKSQGNL